jgi:PhnB protein
MQIQPYLFYNGRCDEAIEFYRTAVGAQLKFLMRYKDSPEPASHGQPDKVMHATIEIGGAPLMVSDGNCTGTTDFQGFALSLNVASEAEAERLFAGLSDGGRVLMPLAKTFFSPKFGMLADRFGVMWMVHVESKAA